MRTPASRLASGLTAHDGDAQGPELLQGKQHAEQQERALPHPVRHEEVGEEPAGPGPLLGPPATDAPRRGAGRRRRSARGHGARPGAQHPGQDEPGRGGVPASQKDGRHRHLDTRARRRRRAIACSHPPSAVRDVAEEVLCVDEGRGQRHQQQELAHLAADGRADARRSPSPTAAPASRARNKPRRASRRDRRRVGATAQEHDLPDGGAHHPQQETVDDEGDAHGPEGGGVGLAGDEHDQQQLGAAGQHLVDQRRRPARPRRRPLARRSGPGRRVSLDGAERGVGREAARRHPRRHVSRRRRLGWAGGFGARGLGCRRSRARAPRPRRGGQTRRYETVDVGAGAGQLAATGRSGAPLACGAVPGGRHRARGIRRGRPAAGSWTTRAARAVGW